MTLLLTLLSATLGALALVHAYWGFGGFWPGTDERSLARTVVGVEGIERMPQPASCFLVAFGLLVAAFWPHVLLGRIGPTLPGWFLDLGGVGAAAIFLARGLVGFLPAWRRMTPEQPFARLDHVFYSPLCLLLGLGLLFVAAVRMTA